MLIKQKLTLINIAQFYILFIKRNKTKSKFVLNIREFLQFFLSCIAICFVFFFLVT